MNMPLGCPRHQIWSLPHSSSVILAGQFALAIKQSFLCLSLWVNSVREIGRPLLSGDKPRGHFGHWSSYRQCETTAEGGLKGGVCSSPANSPAGEGCQRVRQLLNRPGLRGVWAAGTSTLLSGAHIMWNFMALWLPLNSLSSSLVVHATAHSSSILQF